MESLREHWLTWLSLLFAAFLIGIGLLGAIDLDESAGARVAFLLVLVPLGLALLLGLWLLREGRAIPAAYTLIVVPVALSRAGILLAVVHPDDRGARCDRVRGDQGRAGPGAAPGVGVSGRPNWHRDRSRAAHAG